MYLIIYIVFTWNTDFSIEIKYRYWKIIKKKSNQMRMSIEWNHFFFLLYFYLYTHSINYECIYAWKKILIKSWSFFIVVDVFILFLHFILFYIFNYYFIYTYDIYIVNLDSIKSSCDISEISSYNWCESTSSSINVHSMNSSYFLIIYIQLYL